MAAPPEVYKNCRNGHRSGPHRLTKPGKTECLICGVPIWIGKADMAAARSAGTARNDVDHQADNLADPWADETPFASQHLTPRPDAEPRGSECGSCGQPATHSTPRGTYAWCLMCGPQLTAATGTKLAAAARQLAASAAAKAAAAKAAADAARFSQPRPLSERLDIAGTFAVLLTAIDGTITRLGGAASPGLAAEAAETIGRLRMLKQEISQCQRAPDPLAALADLRPYIEAENSNALDLAGRIEKERGEIETDAAMERERLRLMAARERPALPPARPPARPADLAKLMIQSGAFHFSIPRKVKVWGTIAVIASAAAIAIYWIRTSQLADRWMYDNNKYRYAMNNDAGPDAETGEARPRKTLRYQNYQNLYAESAYDDDE